MKTATVALIIRYQGKLPSLVDTLSDDQEINLLESTVKDAVQDPLAAIQELREKTKREEEEFGNYVEELLSQPFVRPEIQEHGLQWLRSKMRIEAYQRNEAEAARVIADYAYHVFQEDPSKRDFLLAGPTTSVRVRVFILPTGSLSHDAA